MFTIFAASITSQSGTIRLLATGFFYARLQTICGFVPPCWNVNASTALRVIDSGKGRTVFLFSAKTNNFQRDMSITEQNCLNANNSTVPATSAHETCEKLIAFIRDRYPHLNQIKYKISKNGKHLALRARYKRRAIHANGFDFAKTINTFYYYLLLKLSIDKYYPTLEEMREKRPLEPFFVKFNCEIYQKFTKI